MKNMSRIVLFMISGLFLTVTFQNCGKIQPGLNVQDSMAIVTDQNDNLVSVIPPASSQEEEQTVEQPVAQQPVEQQQPAQQQEEQTQAPEQSSGGQAEVPKEESGGKKSCSRGNHHEREVASNDHEEEKKVEEVKADASDVDCEHIAKGFNSKIDIDQIGEERKINLASGKTLIYSKSGSGRIHSISIERANGRTVLCKVDVQNFKLSNGRLELIQSKVRHLEKKNGVVIKDENSVVD